MLSRALPAVVSSGQTGATAIFDPRNPVTQIGIALVENLGATPEACVDKLALRLLLVGDSLYGPVDGVQQERN